MTDAKILIVDDMQENLILLDFALRPFEATVVKARSGFEAEAACLEDEFVLVIMDVHMPERDGIETAEIIRMSTSGLPIDEPLLETVNDFFGSADVTAQERGIAIAGVKSLMDSMSGSLHLASTEAGFEVVLEAPLTQLKRRLGDAS